MSDSQNQRLSLYWRLWHPGCPDWRHLTGIFLLSLLAAPLALLAPIPLKIAVDYVINSHPLPPLLEACLPGVLTQSPKGMLLFAVLLLVFVVVAGQLRDLATAWISSYAGEKCVRDFRAR